MKKIYKKFEDNYIVFFMFDKLLIAKGPGLTQDEINHFREAIVGEVNTQLSISQVLTNTSIAKATSTDEAQLMQMNHKLLKQ